MREQAVAIVMAGGEGSRISVLSERRAKPAVPFGGKYRIIDFVLSNCVNSGVYDIAILTQYRPFSLMEHIGIGRPWGLDSRDGNLRLLPPHLGSSDTDWYRGNADAVYQNLDRLTERGPKRAIVLAGDHVYKMDYAKLLAYHVENHARLTIAATRAPKWQLSQFGVLEVDADRKIIGFQEKPEKPKSDLASMGIYVFDFDLLEEVLDREVRGRGARDFGTDIIPKLFRDYNVIAYPFEDYWRDIGTLESYFEANMDLLPGKTQFQLRDPGWPIYTVSHDRPPVKLGAYGACSDSVVGSGCVIKGRVERSVLFPGVAVEKGAVVRDSIVMHDTRIGRNALLERCILDKQISVGEGSRLGVGGHLKSGEADLTVVGKDARIPPEAEVPAGAHLKPGLSEEDFDDSGGVRRGRIGQ